MKQLSKLSAVAAVITLTAGAAQAATFTWTEGDGSNRQLVAGSIDLGDAPDSGTPIDLRDANGGSAFGLGDILQLHGRIVSAADMFSFSFTVPFTVAFDIDGYALDAGGTEMLSGFVGQNTIGGDPVLGNDKTATFSLDDGSTTQSATLSTDIYSSAGVPGLFTGQANVDYTFMVDGAGNGAGLYDIVVAPVPVPAAGLFLLTALAGTGFMARRRRTT